MSAVHAAPRIGLLLPQGWVRIPVRPEGGTPVDAVVARATADVAPHRRDIARVTLRTRLVAAVRDAEKRGLWEIWMPVAPTNGVFLPVSVAVGPLPARPDPRRSPEDVLVGLASAAAGALAVEIGGAMGVRFLVERPARLDGKGELEAPPVRLANYIVAPGVGHDEWLVFTASIMIPDVDGASEVLSLMETIIDSLMATVTFEEGA